MIQTWQSIEQVLIGNMPFLLAQGTSDTIEPTKALADTATLVGDILKEDVVPLVKDLVTAIAILIVGWIIAAIVAKIVRGILKRTEIDNRLAAWVTGQKSGTSSLPVEKWVSQAIFWIIILFTIVGTLQALQLTVVSEPLQEFLTQISDFLPKLGGAALLVGIAWILATIAKLAIPVGLQQIGLDEKLSQQVAETESTPETSETEPTSETPDTTQAAPKPQYSLSSTIGNVVYWFIFLLFLPSILSTLQLEGTLNPVQNLLDDILKVLPNIFAAVLIGAAGWLIAQIVRRIVTNFLTAAQTDQLGERFGISRTTTGKSLSWVVGTIVYVLILIPTAISALNALQIKAISEPAIGMLDKILATLPDILGATLILAIAYAVARFVSELVTNVLTGIGFNNVFYWLGLQSENPGASADEASATSDSESAPLTTAQKLQQQTPSEIVGVIVLVAILLFAATAAIEVLQIEALANLIQGILIGAGRILAGLIVFAVGLYLANFAFKLISSSGGHQAKILGQTARIVIIAFAGFMGLQQMGVATNIVNLAFGLLLGSFAVAAAIAFGVGGRNLAAEHLQQWLAAFKQNK